MATLTNEKIKLTYAGLIKTNDSGAIGAVAKPLTDGLGNAINMEVLTGQINFPSGTVDFTGSTVNGLPIQPAGLTTGTVANSMQSAASLTTTAANAAGLDSIAIGDAASASNYGGVALGPNAISNGDFGTSIGRGTKASYGAFAGGNDAQVTSMFGLAFGYSSRCGGYNGVAIGANANASASGAVALGSGVTAATVDTVTIKKLQMLDYATLNYADDTAAATAGIPLGGVYHTSGALKIRIA